MTVSRDLAKASEEVAGSVRDRLLDKERLQIVKAPPGAGKTYLLLRLVEAAHARNLRVAVATFTNAQADDICRRLAADFPSVPVTRFLSHRALDPDLGPRVQ